MQVVTRQRGNTYTLIGTKGYGLGFRLLFTVLFAPLFLVSVVSLLDWQFFDGDYFNSVNDPSFQDSIAGFISFVLIASSCFMLGLIIAYFEKVLDYISASLGLSGVARFLLDIQLLRFMPGGIFVLLIFFAVPLSRWLIAPVMVVILKSPMGLALYRLFYRLVFWGFTYLFFCPLVCQYDTRYVYHFDRATDTLRCQWRESFPIPVGFQKDPDSNLIYCLPLVHLRDETYEFPLSAIRSVHRQQRRPTLALDVLGQLLYLPTVTHRNQRECEQTLATLADWLGVERGQDLDAGTAPFRLPADALRAIQTRVLPIKGEKATLALRVTSALTMARRNQQRLTRHPDDPDALLQMGIANLGLGEREQGLRQLAEAERQYRLRMNSSKAAVVQNYLNQARRSR